MQNRDHTRGFPERHLHENLAEYCYKIEAEVTSNCKLTTVRTGEKIAAVLSALINSGGGVLLIGLVTNDGDMHDICLDKCQEDIVGLITQEKWIPEDMLTDSINCTKNEDEKELYFFASNATHMISLHSNANYLKQSKSESIVDNNALVGILRACTCEDDSRCEKHKESVMKSQVLSLLSNTDALNAHGLFPVPKSDSEAHLYRNYQLNGRSLCDVLSTQSVRSEILELVSALANTKGGSLFIGITNTGTPTVEGYNLTENDKKHMGQHICDILTGRNPGPVTIWGNPNIEFTRYCKTWIHDVVGAETVRKVIEIRVNKCPGGMFCALPVCLDINHTGEIYQLDLFDAWKKRYLNSTMDHVNDKGTDDYHKHFGKKEAPGQDTTLDLSIHPTGTSMVPETPTQTNSFPFCWWASDDGVVTESLQFDQCCSKELAESELDISTVFSTFPAIEAVTERFANVEHLGDTLNKILQEYQGHTGVAVFMENLPDTTLAIYATLNKLTNEYHVFDVVILEERQPPVIVTIFKDECSRREAKKYCLTLGQLLKKDCSKYMGIDKGSMKLFFRCQPYFIGHGYENLQQERFYPKDYLHPSTETIDSVRYALARILLDCHHITDRYGNIMVRHLSSYQAKVLLGRRLKVLIVKSVAGSGKTVLALEIARRIKKVHGDERKIIFLCRSRGLAEFVKSQTKGINVFESVKKCNSHTKLSRRSFSRYTDIIIDDAHAIPVQGEPHTWQIYNALFSSLQERAGHAYIFLDPDMQDYRGCTPDDFVTQLEALAGQYVGKYNVQTEPLGKILRNSLRICQFTKACMGTGTVDELSTVRQIPEDGVFFCNIQGRDVNQDESATLLTRLSNLKQYNRQDITILTDSQVDTQWVKRVLKKEKYATQKATQFPVKHIVVDTLENFEGLDSPVILFIIPVSWGSGYVGSLKYRLCVVTRAISRLEFLLPWNTSQREQDLTELKRAFLLAVSMFAVNNILLHYWAWRNIKLMVFKALYIWVMYTGLGIR